jgi:hypothetical protein
MRWLFALPTGRVTKWVVLAAWFAALPAAGPLAGRLFPDACAMDRTAAGAVRRWL